MAGLLDTFVKTQRGQTTAEKTAAAEAKAMGIKPPKKKDDEKQKPFKKNFSGEY